MSQIADPKLKSDQVPMWIKLTVCALLVGIMSAVRLGAFGHRVMPIAFGMPLIAFIWLRDRRLLWGTVAIFVLVTIIKYAFVLPIEDEMGHGLSPTERVVDVALVLVDLFVIAAVLHVFIGNSLALQQGIDDLAASNAELSAREEEIQRQNEELQSSTEELERQSEELRVANDDLAKREHMLETLLDLSRSLNVGVDHDQTLSRICETLGQLINGPTVAAAILLDAPGGFKVRCHYGFGPEGIRNELIPPQNSFAALVLEKKTSGYLEDLSLRPDVIVPQPVSGQAVVSVLATPLRVRNQNVGTLEVYSRERKHWSEEQIALIESLASQTAISLENAQLFEEIDRGRRRLTTILEQVPVGMVVADSQLTDIRLNPAAAAILNESPDVNIAARVQRHAWKAHIDGKPLPLDQSPLLRAVKGERVYPQELEVLMPSGKRIHVLVGASPFHDAEGNILGAVSTFADITQLKGLQRELETRRREAEEASVRKTRFLAAASHDIRTPANAISLLAELLKRTTDNPQMAGEIPQLAEELRHSATSLVNLVSNILDVTRFDTDKIDLHETEFGIGTLMDEEVRQVLPLAQAKNLLIDCENRGTGLWIRADRIKLGRVLGNLLGNAIKFTDNGGVRCACGRRDDGTLFVSVSDTGIGISPDNLAHIFDEFWQLSDPNRSKGSGLGLAISKRLVEAMGGDIKVDSIAGKGSTFTVTLPASASVPRPDHNSSDGSPKSATKA